MAPRTAMSPTEREEAVFASLEPDTDGRIRVIDLCEALNAAGIETSDLRLRELFGSVGRQDRVDFERFRQVAGRSMVLVERALRGQLVIPDFQGFREQVTEIFHASAKNEQGAVADYIPQLSRVDPELYGMSMCTTDGQRFDVGDADVDFCVQSCCKPINYCLALEEWGEDIVHKHIGREPSGHRFNELALNEEGKPHNPMINAGAIMACSLIQRGRYMSDRFEFVLERWREICGHDKVGFSNSVYLSERRTADRNFALGHLMREHDAFPEDTDLTETLEFYFQCCSIEATTRKLSVLAATLANGGVCPTTGQRIFKPSTVQNCLSLMSSCGMYDFSGEFAFVIGLPAKSGVAGAVIGVVPNVLGFCTWSPRLDRLGNSVRGIEFCRGLVKTFNFHMYDNLTVSDKVDPRVGKTESMAEAMGQIIWAASVGDVGAVQQLVSRGIPADCADYDLRTPLHLAAAEGHEEMVSFLLSHGADPSARDRWGHTPQDDATTAGHDGVVELLESGRPH